MAEYYLKTEDEFIGERIDKFIALSLGDLSRSYIQKLIDSGNITVNGKKIKSSYKVNSDDEVYVNTPDAIIPDIVPENISLDILYEDNDVIVVNKPKDMVVHPSAGHYNGTLVNALMYHCKDNLSGINGVMRPGIVHRIDKNTTGSVIACKNDKAHESIAAQLKEHSIKREYRAVVVGNLPNDEGTVNAPIGRSSNDRKKMTTNVSGGKSAVTHYKVIERYKDYTYISCVLETGRTHQIRVHMASIGHPILGDDVYGNIKSPFNLNGQMLHAHILGFIHPTTGEYIETVAPLPDYFTHLLGVFKK